MVLFRAAQGVARLWFTGLLYVLAAAGFVFYGLLWVLRLIQSMRKILFLLLFVAFCVSAAAVWYYIFTPLQPVGEPVEMVVEPGRSLWSVARELEETGVIRSRYALVLWLRLTGNEKNMQAGRCVFKEEESAVSAARKLLDAMPLESEVAIPEGLIIEQVAALLKEGLGIDSAAFSALCYDSSVAHSYGIDANSLEGYLFPDTYRFPPEPSIENVVERMVARFREMYARLGFDSSEHIVEGMGRHDYVTLASIVEKEAVLAEERSRIAGVFHNRLRLGYPLGADPTVRYALRKFSGPLRVSELETSSPYNTRKYVGLPPGPICSPGFGSLQAAADPMETDELYFVARWDGSGAHDFSTTHVEHNRKKRQARQRNEERTNW